ncbi:MAG: DUF3618 domain-containing protein [Streptosporangiales bacterium]|nr:DUF3618 domain-containing protein [Streptosporangiales bacterium]
MSEPTGSPGELERQIEQARTDLARSVDAIVDRVHPKKVVQRSLGRIKQRVGVGGTPVAGQLEHPPGEEPGPAIRKELVIAAAVVVAAGTVAVVVWRRRNS